MSTTIARYFILTAILFFLLACLKGLMLSTKMNFVGIYATIFHLPHEQIKEFFTHFVTKIHTHIALAGWASSAIMGVLYIVTPHVAGQDRSQPWAAYANYVTHTLGVIVLTGGFHLIGHAGAGLPYETPEFRAAVQPVKYVVILGGGLLFVSGLLFAFNMARTLLWGQTSPANQSRTSTALTGALAIALVFLSLASVSPANAETSHAPERADVIMVGDRLVDVAYNLGVVPRAMAVRTTLWPLTETLKGGADILGCPGRVVKKPETVPDAAKRLGVTRILIEKNAEFCTYMPGVNPEKVVPLLEGKGLSVEFVDFNQGLETAVHQTAQLLGREAKIGPVLEGYTVALAMAKDKAKTVQPGKKVLILSGIQQHDTGKITVQIEAPGGYTDRFLLKELGAINSGAAFAPQDGKANKGYYTAPKRKHGVDLAPMLKNAPDLIAIFGNTYAVQKALAAAVHANPTLADIPAIKNHAIYALPQYVDSGVLEYPKILTQWADAVGE